MKRLKINKIQLPEKNSVFTDRLFYTVNLGNGIVKKFKNKAQAVKFLNEVSKYLTYKMHECNELYISAFTYFRRAWFYFDHDKVTVNHNLADLYKAERACIYSFEAINQAFDLMYKRSLSENGNYFVFGHFYTVLESLNRVVENVIKVYENKSAYGILYELEILNKKIAYCRRTIENYSVELENEFMDTEKIELEIIKTA